MTRDAMYGYRAARPDGSIELGVIEAETRAAATERIAGRGLFIIDLRVEPSRIDAQPEMAHRDAALGLRMLGSLLEAGVPVSRALAAFAELAPTSWIAALPGMREAIRSGKSLSAALSDAQLGFPSYVFGIVHAGEAAGSVGPALQRAAKIMESSAETRAAIRGALAYPMVLATAGLASVSFLVIGVLPKFAILLANLGQTLPPTTRFVLDAAGLTRSAALPSLGIGIATWLFWRTWVSTDAGRVAWQGWLLSLPILGRVRWSLASSRITAALSALLATGVPIAPALAHSARAAGDAALGARLARARENVMAGQSLSRALADATALTPLAIRLVGAGEQGGQLPQMLAHASQLEDERARLTIRSAVRLIEPGLILVFGGLVALVAAALLQAVYSVRPTT